MSLFNRKGHWDNVERDAVIDGIEADLGIGHRGMGTEFPEMSAAYNALHEVRYRRGFERGNRIAQAIVREARRQA